MAAAAKEIVNTESPKVSPVLEPDTPSQKPVMNKLPELKFKTIVLPVLVGVIVVAAGIVTGWFASNPQAASTSVGSSLGSTITDKKAPGGETTVEEGADTAEGMLKLGGIDGEGTHYLDRDLGPEKYVYLTSTVLNLDNFEGKKIQVWGRTMAGQKAGWLMDVGKVKVVE